MQNFSIAIHGGAGTIEPSDLTPALEMQYHHALQNALDAGFKVLQSNGTALDAVAAAVVALEDHILFNAGKGSVFTKNGMHEMDASIMNGSNLAAGAVAGVQYIKNPVLLAKAVMQQTEHVLLSGAGAIDFAKAMQFELLPDDYFFSEQRYQQWQQVKNENTVALDHNIKTEKKFGTVGAVACDAQGNIAAATSTGGMTNKQYGRVGDTPLIGSGTYANNNTCAVSCTGHGEWFMKAVAAYDVSCLIEYKGLLLQQAVDKVVHEKLVSIGGEGGLIAVNTNADIALAFNSAGMYRGYKNNSGEQLIAIYK
jgi:beta-aspartyl-peptidase (threonine type)